MHHSQAFQFNSNSEWTLNILNANAHCATVSICLSSLSRFEHWSSFFSSFLLEVHFVCIFHRFIVDCRHKLCDESWLREKTNSVKWIVRILIGSNARNSLTIWILNILRNDFNHIFIYLDATQHCLIQGK